MTQYIPELAAVLLENARLRAVLEEIATLRDRHPAISEAGLISKAIWKARSALAKAASSH